MKVFILTYIDSDGHEHSFGVKGVYATKESITETLDEAIPFYYQFDNEDGEKGEAWAFDRVYHVEEHEVK